MRYHYHGASERSSKIALATIINALRADAQISDTIYLFRARRTPILKPLIRGLRSARIKCHVESQQDLEFQSCLAQDTQERVEFISSIPDSFGPSDLLIFPLCMQADTLSNRIEPVHFWREMAERCLPGAMVETIDWGPIVYPKALAQLPFFHAEVKLTDSLKTPSQIENFVLRRESTHEYDTIHPIEKISEMLKSTDRELFESSVEEWFCDSISVREAFIHRVYERA